MNPGIYGAMFGLSLLVVFRSKEGTKEYHVALVALVVLVLVGAFGGVAHD